MLDSDFLVWVQRVSSALSLFDVKCLRALRAPGGYPATWRSSSVGRKKAQGVDVGAPTVRQSCAPWSEHKPVCVLLRAWPSLGPLKAPQRLACSPLTSDLALRISLSFWGKISHRDNGVKGKGGLGESWLTRHHANQSAG